MKSSDKKDKQIYITAKCICAESLTWFAKEPIEKQVCKFCKRLVYKSYCPHCNEILVATIIGTIGGLNGEIVEIDFLQNRDLPIVCPNCKEYLCIDYESAKDYPQEKTK